MDIYRIYYPSSPHLRFPPPTAHSRAEKFCCEIASACETSLENKISLLQHAKCLYELCELRSPVDFFLWLSFSFLFLSKMRWMPHSNSSSSAKLNYMKLLQDVYTARVTIVWCLHPRLLFEMAREKFLWCFSAADVPTFNSFLCKTIVKTEILYLNYLQDPPRRKFMRILFLNLKRIGTKLSRSIIFTDDLTLVIFLLDDNCAPQTGWKGVENFINISRAINFRTEQCINFFYFRLVNKLQFNIKFYWP